MGRVHAHKAHSREYVAGVDVDAGLLADGRGRKTPVEVRSTKVLSAGFSVNLPHSAERSLNTPRLLLSPTLFPPPVSAAYLHAYSFTTRPF